MSRKGWRVWSFYRYLWVVFHGLLVFPFLAAIGVYGYFVSYKQFLATTDKAIMVYLVTIGMPIVFFLFANLIVWWFMEKKKDSGLLFKVNCLHILANMIMKQGWVEQVKSVEGKTRIKFPKVYLKFKKEKMVISFEARGGRYHDRFLKAGKILEEIFLTDLIEEIREFGFIRYVFAINVVKRRISIEQCVATKTSIQLMEHINWKFDETPHMLIAGGTGGGKTYFLFSLILALLKVATMDICDPKKSDLADLEDYPAFKGHVFYRDADEMLDCLERNVTFMNERFLYMKSLENYKTGTNYAYYDLPPHFIIFDEWGAFYSALDYEQQKRASTAMKQISFLGRQAGVFLILATQRPDAEMFAGGVRDNLSYRVSLGKLSMHGYIMLFGDDHKNKSFYNKNIKGRGYIYKGADVPIEFYSPFVPSNFDFAERFMAFESMVKNELAQQPKVGSVPEQSVKKEENKRIEQHKAKSLNRKKEDFTRNDNSSMPISDEEIHGFLEKGKRSKQKQESIKESDVELI